MKLPFSEKEWQEILKKLYKRAVMDHQFHVLCLRDPHVAIKQISGKEIPKKVKIRFVDESEEMVLMLPAENKKRLSDKQLDALAEGISCLAHHLEIPTSTIIET